jgi:protein associated with RNAse G/E
MSNRLYYRKEKLRGASWEYEIDGGWIGIETPEGTRRALHHRFTYYRPKIVEVRTATGVESLERAGADQWFFEDRWFSLLRFRTGDDRTVGFYVNFSLPLSELRENYYRDLDLELDLWVEPDGTMHELDRDEFENEVQLTRIESAWVDEVTAALESVSNAVGESLTQFGPDIDRASTAAHGLPDFILRS